VLKASEKNADECSKTFQDNNLSEKDEGESEYHDDESAKSDDVFFEDISSSLINIHNGKVNGTTDSTSKQVSTISNPYYSQRELSHDDEENEMKKFSKLRKYTV